MEAMLKRAFLHEWQGTTVVPCVADAKSANVDRSIVALEFPTKEEAQAFIDAVIKLKG